ncbi:MAG TPA: dienelactone hydrolase family protein [Terriglobia bacterium]|nr:dienelactone hydrolase family protein [Terriglobia bacterium]
MNGLAEQLVTIPAEGLNLEGILEIPPGASGIVLFSHGSGSSKSSPRNTFVAGVLHQAGLGTLLMDLLTEDEDRDYARRFDVTLLTQRLAHAVSWLRLSPETQNLRIGLFGASTGAASALRVAATLGEGIGAVVSRGGRPDLAADALPRVKAPTLLIVGGDDYRVLDLNEQAYRRLKTTTKLVIVPGATHLFEEPGTLDMVAREAAVWFKQYLQKPRGSYADQERTSNIDA